VLDLFGDDVLHSYAPYDTIGSVRRFFTRMQPCLAIIIETELWPNLYAACGARGVPLVLANARISPRSVARYRRFISLFRQALSNGIVIAAQSEQDAERFLSLGAIPPARSSPATSRPTSCSRRA
jgi:3-deoxy-D-manno-octulosonic-acid transferase